MDVHLSTAESRVHLALNNMHERERMLENKQAKLSRHYNRLQHTRIIIGLMSELLGVIKQDPDNWDDEPDLVPF